jgi:hypothetical protein
MFVGSVELRTRLSDGGSVPHSSVGLASGNGYDATYVSLSRYLNLRIWAGYMKNLINVFLIAIRLGVTSFGGPVAHIGYFRQEYVEKRGWLDDKSFTDFVAL